MFEENCILALRVLRKKLWRFVKRWNFILLKEIFTY